jgi:hypothetical protein
MKYLFETSEFGISEYAFHLLRSRFNYKTYESDDLHEIIVEKGRLVNNWLLILLVGISLVLFAIYYCFKFYMLLTGDEFFHFYLEELIVPLLPFFIGLYCIYNSMRTGPTVKLILTNGKSKRFPLTILKEKNEIDAFISFLRKSNMFNSKVRIGL